MRVVLSRGGGGSRDLSLTRGFAVGCLRVASCRRVHFVREAWYRRLLYIGHHTTLAQMERVELHTRIALLESLWTWTVSSTFAECPPRVLGEDYTARDPINRESFSSCEKSYVNPLAWLGLVLTSSSTATIIKN
jgi:hypothetical protein